MTRLAQRSEARPHRSVEETDEDRQMHWNIGGLLAHKASHKASYVVGGGGRGQAMTTEESIPPEDPQTQIID